MFENSGGKLDFSGLQFVQYCTVLYLSIYTRCIVIVTIVWLYCTMRTTTIIIVWRHQKGCTIMLLLWWTVWIELKK